jgi:hypothetical protein
MEEHHIQNPLFEYDIDRETKLKNVMKKIELESMERMKKINNTDYDTLNDYFKEIDKILENGRNEFFRIMGCKMTLHQQRIAFG